MRIMAIMLGLLVLLLCSCSQPEKDSIASVRELLGADYAQCKIAAIHNGNRIGIIDLTTLTVKDLPRHPPVKRYQGLSRPHWSPDGLLLVYAYGGNAFLTDARGATPRRILVDQPKVYKPRFWQNPTNHNLCVIFTDHNSKNTLKRGKYGNTLETDLRTLQSRTLFDLPCDAGPSLDGTHLGEAYRDAASIDLTTEQIRPLHRGQSCNASMSPDNTYRLMFLYLPHTHFGIKTKYGQELWRIRNPQDSAEWQGPRWSTHPEFCCAVAKFKEGYKIVIIHIETKRMVTLKDLPGDWQRPHLWKPVADRSLVSSPRLPTDLLREAQQTTNIESAAALLQELIAEAPDSDEARQAREILATDSFQDELNAQPLLNELVMLEDRLCPVVDAQPFFTDTRYHARNRTILSRMTRTALALADSFPDSRAAKTANALRDQYALPDTAPEHDLETITVSATIIAVSRVPTAEQIAPYREAITFIKVRIHKVTNGTYDNDHMIISLWGMQDGQHTHVAKWKPGQKKHLTVDCLDAHPELDNITRASDANDASLIPYWANLHQPEK